LEPELRFDQRRKPVEALACVHRLRRHVDFHARRQRQHRAPPPATSRTLASTVASTAPVTRTRRPLPSTTSSSPLEGDLSRTRSVRPTRTGTNLGVAPPEPRAGLASRRSSPRAAGGSTTLAASPRAGLAQPRTLSRSVRSFAKPLLPRPTPPSPYEADASNVHSIPSSAWPQREAMPRTRPQAGGKEPTSLRQAPPRVAPAARQDLRDTRRKTA